MKRAFPEMPSFAADPPGARIETEGPLDTYRAIRHLPCLGSGIAVSLSLSV
jgi:hypothetical protein